MFAALLAAVVLSLPGFTENPRLSEIATYAAGKPARMFCPDTADAWRNLPVSIPATATGFTPRGSGESYLDPNVCATLRRKIGEPSVGFASALLTLTHEAQHIAGVIDESAADCAALRKIAAVAITFYRFKSRSDRLRLLVRGAWRVHDSTPPAYQTLC